MTRPTEEEATIMVATLSPEARAAFDAVQPLIGTDGNAFIFALLEAACIVAMAAGCEPEDFARGLKAIWDERALAFSGPAGSA